MNYLRKTNLQLQELEKFKDSYLNLFSLQKFLQGSPGKLVDLESTIKGFDAICKGEYDHLPEAAFYLVGTIEEAIEKAEKLAKDVA